MSIPFMWTFGTFSVCFFLWLDFYVNFCYSFVWNKWWKRSFFKGKSKVMLIMLKGRWQMLCIRNAMIAAMKAAVSFQFSVCTVWDLVLWLCQLCSVWLWFFTTLSLTHPATIINQSFSENIQKKVSSPQFKMSPYLNIRFYPSLLLGPEY